MAPFPKGAKALREAGYVFLNQSYCKAESCGAMIRWYRAPSGQIMPIDWITETPHWLSCAGADGFRKKKKQEPPPSPQLGLFEPAQLREPGED